MTREEAIKEFESELEWAELNTYPYVSKQKIEADKMAIKALEEQDPSVLADILMEERIRGELDYDITYSKDVIPDVKCKLTVSIQDHRPCYCGAELRETWRECKI